MYPVFLEANAVCGLLGACNLKSILGEPTCDECTGAISAVSDLIESPEKINEIIAFLQVYYTKNLIQIYIHKRQ